LPFSNAAPGPYFATIFFFVSRPVVSMTKFGTRRARLSATHFVISPRRARRADEPPPRTRTPFASSRETPSLTRSVNCFATAEDTRATTSAAASRTRASREAVRGGLGIR
jgi:hypothetical protein